MSGAAKKMVRLNDDISSALRLRRANKGRSPHTYKPGDWVQVSADGLAQIKRGKRDNKERERRAKLAHQWSTPLQVRAVKGNRLELVRKRRKYVAEAQHVEPWLKPVVTRKYVQDPFDLDNEDTSNAAAVRFITGHRDDDQGERQYQVQWEHDEDARRRGWLRRDEFNDLELVREYEETLALDAATSGQSRVDTLPPRHDPFDRARERRFARRGGVVDGGSLAEGASPKGSDAALGSADRKRTRVEVSAEGSGPAAHKTAMDAASGRVAHVDDAHKKHRADMALADAGGDELVEPIVREEAPAAAQGLLPVEGQPATNADSGEQDALNSEPKRAEATAQQRPRQKKWVVEPRQQGQRKAKKHHDYKRMVSLGGMGIH